jgi:quercetin dioxygenase-like cupin family protein
MHRSNFKGLAALCLVGVLAGASQSTPAGTNSADAIVVQLLTEQLADIAGKELEVITVEYPPGGGSLPHRHDAYVIVYVLEGSVQMRIRGRELVTLHAGQTFLERPEDVHEVSRNASATAPAKFLVVALKASDKPLSRPVPAAAE